MSLNAKGDKPEPPVEVRLAELEKHVRKRRGANRRRAFALLREADEARALALLVELADAAAGKTKAELGALLVSTGIERFVDRAVRGKYGDVLVSAHAPPDVTDAFVARFEAERARLAPDDVVRRARTLGLVPLASRTHAPGSAAARVLVHIVDDPRMPRAFRDDAARSLAHIEPWALWGRRDELPVELALAGGLAAGVAVPSLDECARFVAALRGLSREERAACVALARLPASALRLPADVRVPLLALVLDDDRAAAEARAVAGTALAELATAEADEAVLARAAAWPAATVTVCARLDAEEARAILVPLMAGHGDGAAEVRRLVANAAALLQSGAFLADATALLAVDPLAAAAMLARMTREPRAAEELCAAAERADLGAATLMLCGAAFHTLGPDPFATARRASLREVLPNIALVARERRPLVVALLERLRLREGVVTDEVDAALSLLRR